MKIVFTGGGTAGHIFPIIAVVREVKKRNPSSDFEFFYIGPKDDFTQKLLSSEGIKVKAILAGKLRRYFSFQNFIDIIFKAPLGFFQAFYYIFLISPDLIFSKGGYGSLSTVLAGWLLMTPIFIHESDVSPGLANRLTSHLALEVFTAFPVEKTEYFPKDKMICVGNPIRQGLLLNPNGASAKQEFQLMGDKPLIVVLGGSQGAQMINNELLSVLGDFLDSFELIHQTGRRNFDEVKKEAMVIIDKEKAKYYHPLPFLSERQLSLALGAADLVISRAGAGTIFEIAALAKPSILVPLANSAQDHQVKNAYVFAENGAAMVLEEANFRAHFLLEKIKQLFGQPGKIKQMSESAQAFAQPQAAAMVAQYIIDYLTQ